MAYVSEVTDQSFDEFARESGRALAYFYGTDCPICPKVTAAFEKVAGETGDDLRFLKVCILDARETTRRYRILGVPTILLLEDGKEISRMTGAIREEDLKGLTTKVSH